MAQARRPFEPVRTHEEAVDELTRRFEQWGVVNPPEELQFRQGRTFTRVRWQEHAPAILQEAEKIQAKTGRPAHFTDLFDVNTRPRRMWKAFRDYDSNVNFVRAVHRMKGTPTDSVLFVRPGELGTIRKLDPKAPDHIDEREARGLHDRILKEWQEQGDLRTLPVFNEVTHVDSRSREELREVLLRCIRHNTGAVTFPRHAETKVNKHIGAWMRGEGLKDEHVSHEQNLDNVNKAVRGLIEQDHFTANDLFDFKDKTHHDIIRTVYEAPTGQSADGVIFHHGAITGTLDELDQDQAFSLRQSIIGELAEGRKFNELSVVRNAIHASPAETPPLDEVTLHETARRTIRQGIDEARIGLHHAHANHLAPHVEASAAQLSKKLRREAGLDEKSADAISAAWAENVLGAFGDEHTRLREIDRRRMAPMQDLAEQDLYGRLKDHEQNKMQPIRASIAQERRLREALAERTQKIREQLERHHAGQE